MIANGSEGASCQEKGSDNFAPPPAGELPISVLLTAEMAAGGNFCSLRPAISYLSEVKLIRWPVLAADVPFAGGGLLSGSFDGVNWAGNDASFSPAAAVADPASPSAWAAGNITDGASAFVNRLISPPVWAGNDAAFSAAAAMAGLASPSVWAGAGAAGGSEERTGTDGVETLCAGKRGRAGGGEVSKASHWLAADGSGTDAFVEEDFSASISAGEDLSLGGCADGGLSSPPGGAVSACRIAAKKSPLMTDGWSEGGTVEREASSVETPLALGAGV